MKFNRSCLKCEICFQYNSHKFIQAKVDILGFYHSLAKGIKEYNGGTDLKHDIALYLEQNLEMYRVNINL